MASDSAAPSDTTAAEALKASGAESAAAPRKRRGIGWRIKWAVRIVFLVVMGTMLAMGCDGWFYYPTREYLFTPKTFYVRYEDAVFPARDGVKLTGWFLHAEGAPKGTIVHFHGNAENISTHVIGAYWLTHWGFNVVVFDYRGYGRSEGRITRAGTVLDGHAALDYTLGRPDVDPQRVAFFGQSLGGAIAIVVAADRPEVRTVVVDATFGEYRRVAARHARKIVYFDWPAALLARLLVSKGHDPADVVKKLAPRPLLVIASGDDRICFPELSRELFDVAAEPKQFWQVDGAPHLGMIETAGYDGQRRIAEFFEQALNGPLEDAAAGPRRQDAQP